MQSMRCAVSGVATLTASFGDGATPLKVEMVKRQVAMIRATRPQLGRAEENLLWGISSLDGQAEEQVDGVIDGDCEVGLKGVSEQLSCMSLIGG